MNLFLLCIQIFFARILDVSIGTTRMLFMVRGRKLIASVLAFFEVLIWLYVARNVLSEEITSIVIPVSYSLGFACGTYIGSVIANKFIDSKLSIFVIGNNFNSDNVSRLKNHGFGVSVINVMDDYEGEFKKMLFIEVSSKSFLELKKLLYEIDSKAFIIANDSKLIINGYVK